GPASQRVVTPRHLVAVSSPSSRRASATRTSSAWPEHSKSHGFAWQSMCATDESVLKGEQWCRKCIWRNLLPQWKQTFGSVEKISSGDFVSLWTGKIDHLADRFSVAEGGVSTSPHPKSHARRPSTVARGILRRHRAAQGPHQHRIAASPS